MKFTLLFPCVRVGGVVALLMALVFARSPALGAEEIVIPETRASWFNSQIEVLKRLEKEQPIEGRARNVILFVGDGMGIATITAARIHAGQTKGLNGEENQLWMDTLPYAALSRTYSANQQTSDSAPTMTAIVTGVKTDEGILSVDQTVVRGDYRTVNETNKLPTILHYAKKLGKSVGLVSTARLTHATPGACYAHSPDRNWEDDADIKSAKTNAFRAGFPDIARQFAEFARTHPSLGSIDVALGGGRSKFLPKEVADPEEPTKTGTRLDGRNLVREWFEQGPNSAFVWNKAGFESVDPAHTDRLLGLFERSHMNYEHDRPKDIGGEPSLSEMTLKAIQILRKNPKGFFLMVEGGRVDHAHHAGNAFRALVETIELDNAVHVAMTNSSPQDTLLIVTADHSHTLSIGGYAIRGNPILGLVRQVGEDGSKPKKPAEDMLGRPYTSLLYANGPGYTGLSFNKNTNNHVTKVFPEGPKFFPHEPSVYRGIEDGRPKLTQELVLKPDYLQEAAVGLASETHGGEDVAIFARGPYAHLFRGVREQHFIFHVMAHAMQPGKHPSANGRW